MAESIVSFAIERVRDLLIEEAKFLWEVEGQVKDMQKELRRIQCFLKDADARQDEAEVVRNWVSEIRDIAYDVEDVIENYILKVASTKQKAGRNYLKLLTSYLTKCTCWDIHKAGSEIVDIKSKISELTTSMQTYGIRPLKEGESLRSIYRKQQKSTQQSHAHVQEDFVGMEDSIHDMVRETAKTGSQHRLVSICGMGGLGKTSLAKKVYSHEEVKRNFDCFAWACVSQQYQVKEVLIEILIKLKPDERKQILELRESELFEALYETQQEKRCLVVLDDIWAPKAWDDLKAAFPMDNTNSKILLTTRNREIAEYVDPLGFIHEPRCLSEMESWELLKRKAFPGREDPPINPEMERLGRNMLRQSGGLPLAIIALGGVLAKKKTLSEWETVQRNIDLDLQKGKIEVSKVLALSYEDLPYHLKPCFLYLANFPEDVSIPARKLIHMWIAEGFFPSATCDRKGDGTVIDVAEHSLNELISRGLVQAQVSKSTGKAKTCRLHDLMRDLCILKAKEENFLNVMNLQTTDETSNGSFSILRVRRLSIYLAGSLPPLEETSHVRALLLFDPKGCGINNWEQVQALFLKFEFLRVLDLEGFYALVGALPSIGDLVHLRYLNLRNTRVEELPESLGQLECMETLDLRVIRTCQVLIPDVLWKMKRLRHLYLPPRFSVSGPGKLRLHTLRNLETLKNFCPSRCEVEDLEKLPNLRKLTFCPLQVTEGLEQVAKVGKITLRRIRYTSFDITGTFTESNLISLSSYPHPCKLYLEGSIQKLPECRQFPNQIRKLVLKKSMLEGDPMPILEKLQNLVALHMLKDAFVGRQMSCSPRGFPQLRSLILSDLDCMEEWEVSEGAFAWLSHLEIVNCDRMAMVPEGLSSVAERQKLEFFYVRVSLGGRFRVVRKGKRWVYQRDGDDVKAAEEWMLDYALQHVVSQLKPAQRRRVALLVQAFESVAPVPCPDDKDEVGREEVEADPSDSARQASAVALVTEAMDAILLEDDVPNNEESPDSEEFNPREERDLSLWPETGGAEIRRISRVELARPGFRARLLPLFRAIQFISLLRAQSRFNPRRDDSKVMIRSRAHW